MNRIRKTVIGAALAGSTLVGGALGATLLNGTSSAQSATTTAPAATAPAAGSDQAQPANGGQPHDPTKGGHVANGVTEALLTGDTADKVKAAAQAAVPGGTVQRVENDAEGSPYEAHMTKSDGTRVTVKVDAAFKVTGVENGGGPR